MSRRRHVPLSPVTRSPRKANDPLNDRSELAEEAAELAADARAEEAEDLEAATDHTPAALDHDAELPEPGSIVDEEEELMKVETSDVTSDPLGAGIELPGADTAGLDAAPSPRTSRVGAGGAGDATGVDEDELQAADDDGSDGSDVDIDEDETDPENPRDLVDLIATVPRP